MKTTVASRLLTTLALAGAVCLSACASTTPAQKAQNDLFDHQYDAFGRAVRQDIAAQVADPDPAWKNTPAPPTSGRRIEAAQKAYHKEQDIQSSSTTFSLMGSP